MGKQHYEIIQLRYEIEHSHLTKKSKSHASNPEPRADRHITGLKFTFAPGAAGVCGASPKRRRVDSEFIIKV